MALHEAPGFRARAPHPQYWATSGPGEPDQPGTESLNKKRKKELCCSVATCFTWKKWITEPETVTNHLCSIAHSPKLVFHEIILKSYDHAWFEFRNWTLGILQQYSASTASWRELAADYCRLHEAFVIELSRGSQAWSIRDLSMERKAQNVRLDIQNLGKLMEKQHSNETRYIHHIMDKCHLVSTHFQGLKRYYELRQPEHTVNISPSWPKNSSWMNDPGSRCIFFHRRPRGGWAMAWEACAGSPNWAKAPAATCSLGNQHHRHTQKMVCLCFWLCIFYSENLNIYNIIYIYIYIYVYIYIYYSCICLCILSICIAQVLLYIYIFIQWLCYLCASVYICFNIQTLPDDFLVDMRLM